MGSSPSLEGTRRKLSNTSSVITSFSSSSSRQQSKKSSSKEANSHLLHKFENDSSITCTIISDDMSMIVSGSEDGSLNVWSALSTPPQLLTTLTGHKGGVTCLAMTDRHIISGSEDGLLVKWSIIAMEPVHVYRGHRSKINQVICSGNFLFSSSYDRTAKAWKLDQEYFEEERTDGGNRTNESGLVCTFRGHEKSVFPIVFIPSGDNPDLVNRARTFTRSILVTGSADCTVRIWCLELADCLKLLHGHSAPVHCLAVDPSSSRRVFSAAGDGLIICWDTVTGDRLRNLVGHEGTVLMLYGENKMLFSASADKTARSWVAEFGEETRCFRASHSPVTRILFFHGMVFTGSADGTARIYDAKSGTLKRVLCGQTSPVASLECVPGRLFTAHSDGSLCVWDTKGIVDETVLGTKEEEVEDSSDDDDSEVQEAIQMLEKYIRRQ